MHTHKTQPSDWEKHWQGIKQTKKLYAEYKVN